MYYFELLTTCIGFVSCESDTDSVDHNKVKIISWDITQSELITEGDQKSSEVIIEEDLPKITHESILNNEPVVKKESTDLRSCINDFTTTKRQDKRKVMQKVHNIMHKSKQSRAQSNYGSEYDKRTESGFIEDISNNRTFKRIRNQNNLICDYSLNKPLNLSKAEEDSVNHNRSLRVENVYNNTVRT